MICVYNYLFSILYWIYATIFWHTLYTFAKINLNDYLPCQNIDKQYKLLYFFVRFRSDDLNVDFFKMKCFSVLPRVIRLSQSYTVQNNIFFTVTVPERCLDRMLSAKLKLCTRNQTQKHIRFQVFFTMFIYTWSDKNNLLWAKNFLCAIVRKTWRIKVFEITKFVLHSTCLCEFWFGESSKMFERKIDKKIFIEIKAILQFVFVLYVTRWRTWNFKYFSSGVKFLFIC